MNLGRGGGEGDVEKLFTVKSLASPQTSVGVRLSRIHEEAIKSPEMLIYVARNFIMLNNILASLLPFAALVSPD